MWDQNIHLHHKCYYYSKIYNWLFHFGSLETLILYTSILNEKQKFVYVINYPLVPVSMHTKFGKSQSNNLAIWKG